MNSLFLSRLGFWIVMNKVFALAFLLLSSCQFGQGGLASVLGSNVRVKPVPYSSSDKVTSIDRRAIINLKGGRKICRSSPFRARDFRSVLEKVEQESGSVKLEDKFLDELFKVGEESGNAASSTSKATLLEVEDNWLKFGLVIYNANRGTKKVNNKEQSRNFFLVIDSITYNATAVYEKQAFSHAGNIDPGYCDSSAEGGEAPPFLYFIPPNKRVDYKPLSNNPLENLILFISGFPIIDRSSQPSFSQQQRIQSASGQGGGSSQQEFYSSRKIRVIPKYTVELTLRGYFITKSGEQVAGFTKRVRLYTKSSL